MLPPVTRTRRVAHCAILLGISALALSLSSCNDDQPDLVSPQGPQPSRVEQAAALLAPNTWATKAVMPQGRSQVKSTSYNNLIFVIGGRTPLGGPRTRVDAYNITTNTWSSRAPLPSARTALNGATTINGVIYVTGGFNTSFALTKTVYAYNVSTNTWTRKADMPQVGSCGAQGTIGGLLYVYAGCTNVPNGDQLFRYNPASNTWVTRAPPPTQHASPAAAGVINGRFYLAGGITDGAQSNPTLNVYNPATNTWATRAPMPGEQSNSATGVIGGRLFAAGGADQNGTTGTLRVYNPATNTWATRAPMTTPRFDAAGTPAAGLLWVMGGVNSAGNTTNKNEAYTP
jgi:N-acetylneuraminic acid mutarotase